ncbi:DUF1344 domain-containing protein [Mesorhizobium sp. NBSH29]|uniref:DUF1344 domain-containing protein n=1 Tax=Mesorhizobium sp. NBSH29 TaxID=2654249 RepID=UPI0018968C5B|nr:DUF1344 domain-containing protein [Mesorhizobium sp. NBSH29]QPC87002.1 DUF1344 domain-containing protein [Mesorhizobium sp. NBSH29]
MKRALICAAAVLYISAGAALAAEAEGKIKSIDMDKLMITLSDGKSYKLPGEFDVEALEEGGEVYLAYDEVNGENLITDMEITQ